MDSVRYSKTCNTDCIAAQVSKNLIRKKSRFLYFELFLKGAVSLPNRNSGGFRSVSGIHYNESMIFRLIRTDIIPDKTIKRV